MLILIEGFGMIRYPMVMALKALLGPNSDNGTMGTIFFLCAILRSARRPCDMKPEKILFFITFY